jgi:hypothetical protein
VPYGNVQHPGQGSNIARKRGNFDDSQFCAANAQHFDPDLADVVEAWPELADADKAAIMGIVRGSR